VRADTVDGDDWILHRSCMRDGAVDASGDWRTGRHRWSSTQKQTVFFHLMTLITDELQTFLENPWVEISSSQGKSPTKKNCP
jgi:hypothetical protein